MIGTAADIQICTWCNAENDLLDRAVGTCHNCKDNLDEQERNLPKSDLPEPQQHITEADIDFVAEIEAADEQAQHDYDERED